MKWILLLCVVAGCSEIFHLDRPLRDDAATAVGDAVDGRSDDGMVDGGRSRCPNPILNDSFDASVPCAPWGNVYSANAVVTEGNGQLTMMLGNTSGAVAGCVSTSNTFAFGTGVTANVTATLQGTGAYTVLQIHPVELQIEVSGGIIRFQTGSSVDLGSASYTPAQTWWRIRPSGATIVGEVSTDGSSWLSLGTTSMTPPSQIGVEITAGSNSGGNVGDAVFDELTICP